MASITDRFLVILPAEICHKIFLEYLDGMLEDAAKVRSIRPATRRQDIWIFNAHEHQKWLQGHYSEAIACIREYRKLKWSLDNPQICSIEEVQTEAILLDGSALCVVSQKAGSEAYAVKPLPLTEDEQAKLWTMLVSMEQYIREHDCRGYIEGHHTSPPAGPARSIERLMACDPKHGSCTADVCELEAAHPLFIPYACRQRRKKKQKEEDVGLEEVFIEKKETPVDRLNATMARQ